MTTRQRRIRRSPTRQGLSAYRWRDGTSEPDASTTIASICVVPAGRSAARHQPGEPARAAGCADALPVWRDSSPRTRGGYGVAVAYLRTMLGSGVHYHPASFPVGRNAHRLSYPIVLLGPVGAENPVREV
jgi:hypothetical protein